MHCILKGKESFFLVDSTRIAEELAIQGRRYLTGNLKRPQDFPHISDDKVEIGITNYNNRTTEAPHWHIFQREYQYMLAGRTRYREVASGCQHQFGAGDFYGILPEVCYTQESDPGTVILFVKHPALDDKITCCHCRREACPMRTEPFVSDKVVG